MNVDVLIVECYASMAEYGPVAGDFLYTVIDKHSQQLDIGVDAFWRTVDGDLSEKVLRLTASPDDLVRDFIVQAQAQAAHASLLKLAAMGSYTWLVKAELVELPTQRAFPPEATLGDEGIADSDLVALLLQYASRAEAILLMAPAPDPEFLFRAIQMDAELDLKGAGIWGVLLYTDEDAELAVYVRKHYLELNEMSGEMLRVLVLERPTDWAAAKQYWKKYLDPRLFRIFANLKWLFYKPYDRSRAYEVAERLGVQPKQLPCLALLPSLPDREILVFPIASPTPQYFRQLFSDLREAAGDPPRPAVSLTIRRSLMETVAESDAAERRTTAAYAKLQERYERILASLERAGTGREPSKSEQSSYAFYGRTVFINRPSGRLRVQGADSSVVTQNEEDYE